MGDNLVLRFHAGIAAEQKQTDGSRDQSGERGHAGGEETPGRENDQNNRVQQACSMRFHVWLPHQSRCS